jgi:hypothetical protein
MREDESRLGAMKMPYFADPANLVVPEEGGVGDGIGEPSSALDYLQDVYRGRRVAEHSRMRAAMAALPFESLKLAVIATNSMSGDRFAELLDRAIARSKARYPKQIELKAKPVEQRDE